MRTAAVRARFWVMRRACVGLCLGLFFISAMSPAPSAAQDVRPLRTDLRVDLPITFGAAALWITSELLKDELAPRTCRWCDDNAFDRGARDGLRWDDAALAGTLSDVSSFAVLPALTFGGITALAAHDSALRGAWQDALIVSETAALAALLNQGVKFAVGRERPFVHALDDADKARTDHPSDNNLSFYSGHTSPSFALAVSAGTVASMRGYRGAWLVWGAGLSVATLSGYLRIAADKHYLSDVLTGAALGGALGVAVPLLFHREERTGWAARAQLGLSKDRVTLTFTH
jgi:membrane-associated phospholipid phosphatase